MAARDDDEGYTSAEEEKPVASPTTDAERSRILVAVRKRPKQPEEAADIDMIDVHPEASSIHLKESRVTVDLRKVVEERGAFQFDYAFDETCSNARIYAETTRPLIDVVRKGGNALVFAFGQTGSGKTHTMLGSADGKVHGLYSLAMRDIVGTLRGMRLSVSFYEIYGGKVFDLLNNRTKVKALEDENKNLNLLGLTEHSVTDHSALLQFVAQGASVRAEGSTHANDRSSRSHAVLTLSIKTRREQKVFGKMTFIDLAGSERGRDTLDLDKKTRAEGAEINRSLLALKECVRALDQRKAHIPFRGSKLTMVLRDCFLGNCVTLMIANVSPAARHLEDTLNTLKYTDRIKELRPLDREAQLACPKEPIVCEKCSFPIFLEDPSLHVCPKIYDKCKFCKGEFVKERLEAHLKDCNEAPMSCPECGGRIKRGELINHQSKCLRGNVACHSCGLLVDKHKLQNHLQTECTGIKVNCPHCRLMFVRNDLNAHVARCPMRQTTCAACGFLVRQSNMKQHQRVCIAVRQNEMAFMTDDRHPKPSQSSPTVAASARGEQRPLQSKPSLSHLKVAVPNTPSRLPPLAHSAGNGSNPLEPPEQQQPQPQPTGAQTHRPSAAAGSRRPSSTLSRPASVVSAAATPKKKAQDETPRKKSKVPKTKKKDDPETPHSATKAKRNAMKEQLSRTQTIITPQTPSLAVLAEKQSSGRKQGTPSLNLARRTSSLMEAGTSLDFAASAEGAFPPRVMTPLSEATSSKIGGATVPALPEEEGEAQGHETPEPSTSRANESMMSPMVMTPCPHCSRSLNERSLEQHIALECLLAPVPCPFANSGCTVRPERRNLAAHLQEALSEHLYLVQAATVSVREENEKLTAKVKLLEAQSSQQHALRSPMKPKAKPASGRPQSATQQKDVSVSPGEKRHTVTKRRPPPKASPM